MSQGESPQNHEKLLTNTNRIDIKKVETKTDHTRRAAGDEVKAHKC